MTFSITKIIQLLMGHKLFIIFIIIGIIIRWMRINLLLFYDESVGFAGEGIYSSGIPTGMIPHPPLSIWLYKFSVLIFGPYTYSIRLIPLTFGLLEPFA